MRGLGDVCVELNLISVFFFTIFFSSLFFSSHFPFPFLSDKCFLVKLRDSDEPLVVVESLGGDLPDGLVRVERDVRGDDDVMHGGQFCEFGVVLVALLGHVLEHEGLLAFEDVEGGAKDFSGLETIDQVGSVDDLTSGGVDDDHVLPHLGD